MIPYDDSRAHRSAAQGLLTPVQAGILAVLRDLSEATPATGRQVADAYTGKFSRPIGMQNLYANLDRMVAKGLVFLEVPKDHRTKPLMITDKGKEALDEFSHFAREIDSR